MPVLVAAAAITTALCALVGGCSSGEAAEGPDGPDRDAQQQDVGTGWDLEFHVLFRNATSKPVEIGVATDPALGPDHKQLVSVATDGVQWQSAGSGRVLVVPPSPDGGLTVKEVDLFVQQKVGAPRVRKDQPIKPDSDGSQDLLVSLPTMQLRFRQDYDWQRADGCGNTPLGGQGPCDYTRVSTMNVQTRFANGWQAGYSSIHKCLDPTELVNFDTEIGDPTKSWNAKPADDFDTVTIDLRSPTTMAKQVCPDTSYPGTVLTAMSLAPTSKPSATDRVNWSGKKLPDAQLAGADLSWANLSGLDLSGDHRANLAYARLRHTNLRGAILSDAILAGADLTGADVTNASFRDALLYDVDLSTTTGTLLWQDVQGAHFCNTTLPAATIADYQLATGATDPPDTNGSCDEKITAAMGAPAGGTVLVDTNSSVPLTLLTQSSSFDCSLPSAVGSFGSLPLPAAGCTGSYGSSRLIEQGVPDDDVERTTTTLPGQNPPLSAIRDGSIQFGPAGPTGAVDGLSLSVGPLSSGWSSIVCLFVQRDPETGVCQDRHRALAPTT